MFTVKCLSLPHKMTHPSNTYTEMYHSKSDGGPENKFYVWSNCSCTMHYEVGTQKTRGLLFCVNLKKRKRKKKRWILWEMFGTLVFPESPSSFSRQCSQWGHYSVLQQRYFSSEGFNNFVAQCVLQPLNQSAKYRHHTVRDQLQSHSTTMLLTTVASIASKKYPHKPTHLYAFGNAQTQLECNQRPIR